MIIFGYIVISAAGFSAGYFLRARQLKRVQSELDKERIEHRMDLACNSHLSEKMRGIVK